MHHALASSEELAASTEQRLCTMVGERGVAFGAAGGAGCSS